MAHLEPDDDPKLVSITVRCSPEQRERMNRAAKAYSLSLSGYLRLLLSGKVSPGGIAPLQTHDLTYR